MSAKRIPQFIVIDDEPVNNLICRKVIQLAEPDAAVYTFTNPEEGVAFIKSLQPGTGPYLLLLDINMPVMSGWELLDAVAEPLSRIPITTYVLSSSIAACDMEQAEAHPQVKDYILKPLSVPAIKALLAVL
jgi:CheY-like chemotaxis protein